MNPAVHFGRFWRVALVILSVLCATAAFLNMTNSRIPFFSTHLADLACPASLYITYRLNWQRGKNGYLTRTFGRTPEIAAVTFFLGSAVTELLQHPTLGGYFPGTFDPLDLLAFAVGIATCYGLEKRGSGMIAFNGSTS